MLPRILKNWLFALLLLAAGSSYAPAANDLTNQRFCNYCGMDRKVYGYSRMVLHYDDGSSAGVCSIHCAVIDMKTTGERRLRSVLVADRNTRELLSAETAHWVLGGRKRGVMTHRPKWAFATKAAAEAFIAANGGALADWPTALAAAREDAGR